MGRPTKMTPSILEKLEQSFIKGLSDEEACLVAEIDPKTLYSYCHSHITFSSKKELLKSSPRILAKFNIYKGLQDGDTDLSKWYLERRAKDEFSTKQIIENDQEKTTQERLDALGENIKRILTPKLPLSGTN